MRDPRLDVIQPGSPEPGEVIEVRSLCGKVERFRVEPQDDTRCPRPVGHSRGHIWQEPTPTQGGHSMSNHHDPAHDTCCCQATTTMIDDLHVDQPDDDAEWEAWAAIEEARKANQPQEGPVQPRRRDGGENPAGGTSGPQIGPESAESVTVTVHDGRMVVRVRGCIVEAAE